MSPIPARRRTRPSSCTPGSIALLILCLSLAPAFGGESEAERLVDLLKLRPSATVAEIGAGDGELTVEVARLLGAGSRVYTTELRNELPALQRVIDGSRLTNVKVIEAGVHKTRLPRQCCDAIFMRRVYHHFQKPERNNRSAFHSLRPGGRLMIIDFQPRKDWKPPAGVNHRGGHGVSQKDMIREVTAAGFLLERVEDDWPGDLYAVVFIKKN